MIRAFKLPHNLLRLGALLAATHAATAYGLVQENELKATLKELEDTHEKKVELDEKLHELQEELDEIRGESIEMAQTIRAKEEQIAEKVDTLNVLEEQLAKHQLQFRERRDDIAKLLYGMIRMQRMPRQFVIAQPGNAEDLLRTASALEISYSASNQEIEMLHTQLEELSRLQHDVSETRDELQEEKLAMLSKQDKLQSNLKKRQQIQQKLSKDQQALKRRIKQLSSESSSMRELLAKLEQEQSLFKRLGAPRIKPESPPKPGDEPFVDMKGRLPYPAGGKLLHRFGDKNGAGDHHQGQVIQTFASALVTAPHKGSVVFSGDFMDYGNMIIIQHDKKHHLVLAGLDKVKVEPGQTLEAGEPVGVMGNTLNNRELYIELRKDSKAIDPAAWMGKLNSNVARRN